MGVRVPRPHSQHCLSQNIMSSIADSGLPIYWVLGGPGSGKGTQCKKIAKESDFTHLSSGALLRAEVASGSSRGKELAPMIANGQLVPLSTVLDLVKEAMLKNLSTSKGSLIDGYPRDIAQAEEFERSISPCKQIIFFELSDETMTARLLQREGLRGLSGPGPLKVSIFLQPL